MSHCTRLFPQKEPLLDICHLGDALTSLHANFELMGRPHLPGLKRCDLPRACDPSFKPPAKVSVRQGQAPHRG